MNRLALALVLTASPAWAGVITGGYKGSVPVVKIGGGAVVNNLPKLNPALTGGLPKLTIGGVPALTPTVNSNPSVVPGISLIPSVQLPGGQAAVTGETGAFGTLAELGGPGQNNKDEGAGITGDKLNKTFDNSKNEGGDSAVPSEDAGGFGVRRELPKLSRSTPAKKREGKAPNKKDVDSEDRLELQLMYAGTYARGLIDSHIWGDVKFVKPTEGSQWWWNKFNKGETILISAGSDKLFYTQLTEGRTVPIGQLTKEDLAGIFTTADIARNPISELRKAVIERLTKAHKGQFDITLRTSVRLVHFKTPKQLNAENREGQPKTDVYDPLAPRAELRIPKDSPLHRLNEYYPKAVMVDLDLFGDRIPPRLLEDMGKLQRSGVKFVFFSNTTGKSYKAQQTQILGALYGSIFALDGGALVTAHSRDQAHTRVADLLTEYDRGLLLQQAKQAAYELGINANEVSEAYTAGPDGAKKASASYFTGQLSPTADAEAFKTALQARLEANGLRGLVLLDPAGKGPRRFRIQHRHITSSMSDVVRALQTMGVYANPQEILVISDDSANAKSLEVAVRELVAKDAPGVSERQSAIQAAPDAKSLAGVPLAGTELLENAIGAVLGEYRQNMKGDFITSASGLDSFAHYTDRFFSQELIKGEENVYAFWGHETHDVMNWVAWVQRNTGKAPSEEEAVERLRRQWDEAVHSPELAVYLPPGRDFVDLREAAVGRLKGIYQVYARIMAIPGVHFIGTEVPNIFSLRNLDRKLGEMRRVFIRTIFDFVALIPSPDGKGMDLWIMDFKSGVVPTQEILIKKIQPRTYRLFTSYKWSELPREYAVASDDKVKVKSTELEFIYNRTGVYVPLNNWDDRRTELEIIRLADKMRLDKQRTHIRPKRKARGPVAKGKNGAVKPAKRQPKKKS